MPTEIASDNEALLLMLKQRGRQLMEENHEINRETQVLRRRLDDLDKEWQSKQRELSWIASGIRSIEKIPDTQGINWHGI